MSRVFLQYVLPLVLPIVLYLLWGSFQKARAEKTGKAPHDFSQGPWFWLIVKSRSIMTPPENLR